MSVRSKKIIQNIIRINPILCLLQDKIEREQDGVIADLTSPAEKIVKKLIELDNRRIDLCNLNVLYGFIERGLGERFELFKACALADVDSDLYQTAVMQIGVAGYTPARAEEEFAYLFKQLGRKRKKRVAKSVYGGESAAADV